MREFEPFAKSKQLKNKTYYASLWSAICMISFASLLFFLIHTKALIAYIDQLEIIGLGIFFSIVCLLVLLEMPMLKRLPRIKFLLILNFCILSYLLAQLLFLL
jgi:predicted tellurium resistance membrane protein TerC